MYFFHKIKTNLFNNPSRHISYHNERSTDSCRDRGQDQLFSNIPTSTTLKRKDKRLQLCYQLRPPDAQNNHQIKSLKILILN